MRIFGLAVAISLALGSIFAYPPSTASAMSLAAVKSSSESDVKLALEPKQTPLCGLYQTSCSLQKEETKRQKAPASHALDASTVSSHSTHREDQLPCGAAANEASRGASADEQALARARLPFPRFDDIRGIAGEHNEERSIDPGHSTVGGGNKNAPKPPMKAPPCGLYQRNCSSDLAAFDRVATTVLGPRATSQLLKTIKRVSGSRNERDEPPATRVEEHEGEGQIGKLEVKVARAEVEQPENDHRALDGQDGAGAHSVRAKLVETKRT